MRIHRDGSFAHAEGWGAISNTQKTPCQESAISVECRQFYSGDNYGLGWGPSLITSTSHERVFYPSHEHGSSPVPDPIGFLEHGTRHGALSSFRLQL
jgi:hypothetical protein